MKCAVIDVRPHFFVNVRPRNKIVQPEIFRFSDRATGCRIINKMPGLKVRLPSGQEIAKNNLTILTVTHAAYPASVVSDQTLR